MEGLLSIIIPSYNEGLLIDNTANVVVDIMTEHKIPYEILFVDDGSKDDTWNRIQAASKKHKHVRVFISLETLVKNLQLLQV